VNISLVLLENARNKRRWDIETEERIPNICIRNLRFRRFLVVFERVLDNLRIADVIMQRNTAAKLPA